MFGNAAMDDLRQVERSLTSVNAPYRRHSATELREKFPMFRFDSRHAGIYDVEAGLIRADRAILSYQVRKLVYADENVKKTKYISQYPVLTTVQSALHLVVVVVVWWWCGGVVVW